MLRRQLLWWLMLMLGLLLLLKGPLSCGQKTDTGVRPALLLLQQGALMLCCSLQNLLRQR